MRYVDVRTHTEVDPLRSLTPKDIGALIRDARLESGMTQAELGTKIGASRFWVAEFERGKPRAELGLALKALRALRLTLTIEPRDAVVRREEERNIGRAQVVAAPDIDRSTILNRSTTPMPVDINRATQQPTFLWSNQQLPPLISQDWSLRKTSEHVEPEAPQRQRNQQKRKPRR